MSANPRRLDNWENMLKADFKAQFTARGDNIF